MGEVVQLPSKKKTLKEKHKGKTLCKSGFHKWDIDKKQIFDVKEGRLVTLFRCTRCGYEKVQRT